MAYALVGLGRFDEARAIYHQLFEKTGSHVHLHQLGMVEREAGDLRRAAAIFEKEEGILPSGDRLALAANLYERALVASLREDRMEARTLARRCLAIGLETTDPVMHGCAFRLLADVTREADPERARRLYHRARAAFAQAGDAIACDEIDERLAGLA
jgi:tetratricopeptide (TPR) repeat protein